MCLYGLAHEEKMFFKLLICEKQASALGIAQKKETENQETEIVLFIATICYRTLRQIRYGHRVI